MFLFQKKKTPQGNSSPLWRYLRAVVDLTYCPSRPQSSCGRTSVCSISLYENWIASESDCKTKKRSSSWRSKKQPNRDRWYGSAKFRVEEASWSQLFHSCVPEVQDAVKVMAKSLVRNRHAVTKMYSLKSQLQAVSLRMAVSSP